MHRKDLDLNLDLDLEGRCNMGGLVRLIATIGIAGYKALKNAKRKSRRKSLGLPEKTKMQQRSSDKVKEAASKFVKRRKQLKGK